jgi:hypothetical protein
MRGEAFRIIKSLDKNRCRAEIDINRDRFGGVIKSIAKQLIKFNANRDTSLKPSEQKVSDMALSFYQWNQVEINRLNEFFRTRNVIESKKIKSMVKKINDAVRNNQDHDKLFEKLREDVPEESPLPPKCVDIKIYINFLNKKLWKN